MKHCERKRKCWSKDFLFEKSKKLTQQELMKKLSFNNLSRYETNERKPSIDVLIALSGFFNVSIDWILTGKEFTKEAICESAVCYDTRIELDEYEQRLVGQFRQLNREDQIKILERIDVYLENASSHKK